MTTPDALEAAKPWMQQCGPHAYGVDTAPCGCPPDGDPRPIVFKLASELESARAALLAVADVFGYDLSDQEKAEQIREGWQGVPLRVAEDLSALRSEVERSAETRRATAIGAVRRLCWRSSDPFAVEVLKALDAALDGGGRP